MADDYTEAWDEFFDGLSARTTNVIKYMRNNLAREFIDPVRIDSPDDLRRIPDDVLLCVRNLGPFTLREIRKRLEELFGSLVIQANTLGWFQFSSGLFIKR